MQFSFVCVSVFGQTVSPDVVESIEVDFVSHQLLKAAKILHQISLDIVP